MSGTENPVISALDNANALQEKIRARIRWLTTQLSAKELLAAETWLAEIVLATQGTQAELKALRELEHERRPRSAAERQDAARKALTDADERQLLIDAQFL